MAATTQVTGQAGAGRLARALWLEVRVIPVLLWSFSALTLGTALAWHAGAPHDLWLYAGVVTLGVLIQGLLAHTVNDILDWRSGTDGHPAPRAISGGSKVLPLGLASERTLALTFGAALAATAALGIALVVQHGAVLLLYGLGGVAGAVAYSTPPLRAAYRPFAGEAVAFACVVLCVAGAARAAGGAPARVVLPAAVAVAAYAVGMLMVHHYLDRDADRYAQPPKVTSVVRLGLRRARVYATAWCLLALGAALVAATDTWALAPLVVAYAAAVPLHLRCRPDDPASVTRTELAVIVLGVVGPLVAACLLAPVLAVVLVPIAAALALERAAGPTPAELDAAVREAA